MILDGLHRLVKLYIQGAPGTPERTCSNQEAMNPPAELHSATQTATHAIAPLVDALAEFPAFNGAVLFVPDRYHADSAGAVAAVNATGRPTRQLAFTRRHILGRRVDLRATTLGDMFRHPTTDYQPSRLNPGGHVVYGLAVGQPALPSAIIQLAFDTTQTLPLPSVTQLRDLSADQAASINQATKDLLRASAKLPSLADALMLNTPTTPNAFVIMWDITGSSQLARQRYGHLRHFLNTFGPQVATLAAAAGGSITSLRGDGQNIVVMFPDWVDRADNTSIQRFVVTVARPLMADIRAAQRAIGRPMNIQIRLSAGLAHVEQSYLGEVTGVELFRLAHVLKKAR